MAISRAVHPIRRSDPPEDSDRNRPENRPIRLSQRSAAGHLFQKPTPAGRSRFSSPKSEKTRSDRCAKNIQQKFPESGRNFQNPAIFSRFRRYFPDPGDIFQIPASNFQIPTSNFQILATNFHISATYQVDLVIFRPNLVKSHWI